MMRLSQRMIFPCLLIFSVSSATAQLLLKAGQKVRATVDPDPVCISEADFANYSTFSDLCESGSSADCATVKKLEHQHICGFHYKTYSLISIDEKSHIMKLSPVSDKKKVYWSDLASGFDLVFDESQENYQKNDAVPGGQLTEFLKSIEGAVYEYHPPDRHPQARWLIRVTNGQIHESIFYYRNPRNGWIELGNVAVTGTTVGYTTPGDTCPSTGAPREKLYTFSADGNTVTTSWATPCRDLSELTVIFKRNKP